MSRTIRIASTLALVAIFVLPSVSADHIEYGEPYYTESYSSSLYQCGAIVAGFAHLPCAYHAYVFGFSTRPGEVLTDVVFAIESDLPSIGRISYHWTFDGTDTPTETCALPCHVASTIDPHLAESDRLVSLEIRYVNTEASYTEASTDAFLALQMHLGVGAFYNGHAVPEDYSPLD